MKRNFQFDGMSVVRWGDRYIDLHNAYDLEGFGTGPAGDTVEIRFKRNAYAIDPINLPRNVTLRCTGRVRLAFNDLCKIPAPIDSAGIEIAYFDGECDWLSFLDEELAQRQEPEGLHLGFGGEFAVRIFCDETLFSADDGR